jgi:transposase
MLQVMTTTKPSTQSARDLAALEQRRLKAAKRFADGASQAQVAREFGVSAQTASRWQRAWRAGGRGALRTPKRFGRPARRTNAQWRGIETILLAGALAHGYDQHGWTLTRVRELTARRTGITYHPAHVWASSGPSVTPEAPWPGRSGATTRWVVTRSGITRIHNAANSPEL